MKPAHTQVSNRRGTSAWATEGEAEREEYILNTPAMFFSKVQTGAVTQTGATDREDTGHAGRQISIRTDALRGQLNIF